MPGLQIVASALLALPFRANIPVAAAATFASNPITTPFILIAAVFVGNDVFGLHADPARFELLIEQGAGVGQWFVWFASDAAPGDDRRAVHHLGRLRRGDIFRGRCGLADAGRPALAAALERAGLMASMAPDGRTDLSRGQFGDHMLIAGVLAAAAGSAVLLLFLLDSPLFAAGFVTLFLLVSTAALVFARFRPKVMADDAAMPDRALLRAAIESAAHPIAITGEDGGADRRQPCLRDQLSRRGLYRRAFPWARRRSRR